MSAVELGTQKGESRRPSPLGEALERWWQRPDSRNWADFLMALYEYIPKVLRRVCKNDDLHEADNQSLEELTHFVYERLLRELMLPEANAVDVNVMEDYSDEIRLISKDPLTRQKLALMRTTHVSAQTVVYLQDRILNYGKARLRKTWKSYKKRDHIPDEPDEAEDERPTEKLSDGTAVRVDDVVIIAPSSSLRKKADEITVQIWKSKPKKAQLEAWIIQLCLKHPLEMANREVPQSFFRRLNVVDDVGERRKVERSARTSEATDDGDKQAVQAMTIAKFLNLKRPTVFERVTRFDEFLREELELMCTSEDQIAGVSDYLLTLWIRKLAEEDPSFWENPEHGRSETADTAPSGLIEEKLP
ncbi:MAG TPA: hypothetical protein PKO06_03185 [Candidatus Ozemobacteraceae bacterium]|nr:hypothetical protein [Candidatus Ozemobacteraceae bacterium]